MSKRLLINLMLGFSLLGLIILQSVAYKIATRNITAQWIAENHNTINHIDNIHVLYEDMEINRRKYLLGNHDSALSDMQKSISQLIPAVDELSQGVSRNIEQLNRVETKLRPLIIESIAFMNKLADVTSERGISLTTQFEKLIREIKDEEVRFLNLNIEQDRLSHDRLSKIIFIASLVSVAAVIILFILVNTYIDKKIRSESFEHDQKQLFQSILDCMGDGVLVRDMNGQFIMQNPTAKKLIGDNMDKLQIFKEDRKTFLTESELPINIAINGHSLDNSVYFVKSENYPNGLYVNVSARPLLTKDGKRSGAVAVFSDVTAIKEVQDQLESFNYSVSHDLSAPLRSIIGFSQILLEENGEHCSAESHDALARIIGATHKMKYVIEGLLELSKLKRAPLNRERVNLSKMASEIASDLQRVNGNRKINFIIPKEYRGQWRLPSFKCRYDQSHE